MNALRRYARPLLSVVVLGAVGLWVARSSQLGDLAQAVERLPLWALAVGYGFGVVNITLGATRWRVLMRAFGARVLAARLDFLRATFVGHFYNTFVPGAFGGDLVRGFITRKSFDQPATGLIVVFFDRIVGLTALCGVVAVGLALGPPLVDLKTVGPWLAGFSVAAVVACALAALTGRLTRFRSWLPRVVVPHLLLPALGISVVGHGLNLLTYLVLAHAMGLPVSDLALLLIVPLAGLATLLPIAMAGVGVREAALLGLLHLLGVPSEEALVFALGFAVVNITLASTGGLLQLLQPNVLRYH